MRRRLRTTLNCILLLFALVVGWIWLRTPYEGFWIDLSPGGHLDLLMMVRSYGVQLDLDTNTANKIKRIDGQLEPWGVRYEAMDGVESREDYGHAEPFFHMNTLGFGYKKGQAEQPFRPDEVRDSLSEAEETSWREHQVYPSRAIVEYQLIIPYWLLLALPLLPASARAVKGLRRRRRARRGMCVQCGYDLRSSSQRCPECGQAFATTPMSPARARLAITGGCAVAIVVILFVSERFTRPSTVAAGVLPLQTWQLPFRPEWLAAEGSSRDRMLRETAYGHALTTRWYQSIWRHDGEENIVVLVEYGDGRWHNGFDVYVFERDLKKVVRWGHMKATRDDVPYRLVEIRSDDAAIPAQYRDRWSLAVQTLWVDSMSITPAPSTAPADKDLSIEIIEWIEKPRRGGSNDPPYKLSAPESFEVRAAEPQDQDEHKWFPPKVKEEK